MSTAAQDADGDSQMDQITGTTATMELPGTHSAATTTNRTLSPPLQTQTPPRNPTANANGKRPLNTISNGHDDDDEAVGNETKEENDDSMGSDMDPQSTSTTAGLDVAASSSDATTAAATAAGAGTPAGSGKERQEFQPKVHAASGYTWKRPEDEPGASWLNKKALDENVRAVDSALHKECVIAGKYGDPFEMAEKEAAMQNSLANR